MRKNPEDFLKIHLNFFFFRKISINIYEYFSEDIYSNNIKQRFVAIIFPIIVWNEVRQEIWETERRKRIDNFKAYAGFK